MQLSSRKNKIKSLPRQTGRFLIDAIFPEKCYGCSSYGSYICISCIEKDLLPHSICPHCEKRLPFGYPEGECKRGTALDRIFTCSDYSYPAVNSAIKDLKYRSAYKVAGPLADLACDWALEQDLLVEVVSEKLVVVPVPSYIKKEKKRGFNPAEKIAEQISARLKLEIGSGMLIKIKNTKAQVEAADKKERENNLKGSFKAFLEKDAKGKTILLVDDVVTTGSTMRECSIALRKAGARKVWGLAIARD